MRSTILVIAAAAILSVSAAPVRAEEKVILAEKLRAPHLKPHTVTPAVARKPVKPLKQNARRSQSTVTESDHQSTTAHGGATYTAIGEQDYSEVITRKGAISDSGHSVVIAQDQFGGYATANAGHKVGINAAPVNAGPRRITRRSKSTVIESDHISAYSSGGVSQTFIAEQDYSEVINGKGGITDSGHAVMISQFNNGGTAYATADHNVEINTKGISNKNNLKELGNVATQNKAAQKTQKKNASYQYAFL